MCWQWRTQSYIKSGFPIIGPKHTFWAGISGGEGGGDDEGDGGDEGAGDDGGDGGEVGGGGGDDEGGEGEGDGDEGRGGTGNGEHRVISRAVCPSLAPSRLFGPALLEVMVVVIMKVVVKVEEVMVMMKVGNFPGWGS